MKKTIKLMLLAGIAVLLCTSAYAQKKNAKIDVAKALEGYFTPAGDGVVPPDHDGFIRRWMLLEPISVPNNSNKVFSMAYTREAITQPRFPDQMTVLPKDGDKVKVNMEYQPPVVLTNNRSTRDPNAAPKFVDATLTWHALDSDHFFVKLFRMATGLDKDRYGVLFWSVTVINCEEEIKDVRLSVGSNCGALWTLNGEELLLLATDRHMGVDSAVSKRVTLKKGKNILRGATINGVGMSEFCVRFIDDEGKPVRNFTVSTN